MPVSQFSPSSNDVFSDEIKDQIFGDEIKNLDSSEPVVPLNDLLSILNQQTHPETELDILKTQLETKETEVKTKIIEAKVAESLGFSDENQACLR